MYVYIFQLNWPSLYERGAWSYKVDEIKADKLLTKEELIDNLDKVIKDQVKGMFYMSRIPKDDKDFESKLMCEDEEFSCFLVFRKICS